MPMAGGAMRSTIILKVAVVASAASIITGCATFGLTYPSPEEVKDAKHLLPPVDNWQDMSTRAQQYEAAYSARAQAVGQSATALELPVVAAAIAVVGLTTHEVYPRTILDVALGAGALNAIETYAAPRDRIAIYASASQATGCLAQLAREAAEVSALPASDGNTLRYKVAARLSAGYKEEWQLGGLSLKSLEQFRDFGPSTSADDLTGRYKGMSRVSDITSSINAINTKVLERLKDATKQPNFAEIRDALLSALRKKESEPQPAPPAKPPENPPASLELLFTASEKVALEAAFRFIEKFDDRRNGCATLAGVT